MKCPKCQFENPETQRFCGECGTKLISAESLKVSKTMTLETPAEKLTRGTVFAGRYEIIEEPGRGKDKSFLFGYGGRVSLFVSLYPSNHRHYLTIRG